MPRQKNNNYLIYILGIIPVVWLSLLVAPNLKGNLLEIIENILTSLSNPLNIILCNDSLLVAIVFIFAYIFIILCYLTSIKNYRRGEEYGSAKWGNPKQINKKYMQNPINNNKILTQNVCIGLDGRIHRRNLNTLVVGGSGSGKTRFYAKLNVMQCNTSFFVLDPKGEILRDTGHLIVQNDYNLLVPY